MTDLNDELYHQKYLKYKQKYLQLKKIGVQSGGGDAEWESYQKKEEQKKKSQSVSFTEKELCEAYKHGIRTRATIGACYGLGKITQEERDSNIQMLESQKERRKAREAKATEVRNRMTETGERFRTENLERMQRFQSELIELEIQHQQIEQTEAQNPNKKLILEINVLQQRLLNLKLQKYDDSGNFIIPNLEKLDTQIKKLERELETKVQKLEDKLLEDKLEEKKPTQAQPERTQAQPELTQGQPELTQAQPERDTSSARRFSKWAIRRGQAAAVPIGTEPTIARIPDSGAAAAVPASLIDESDTDNVDLEISENDVSIFADMSVNKIIEYIDGEINKIKNEDRKLINDFKKGEGYRYLLRNRVIFQSLLEKIDTLGLSIFLKKIYKEKINSENISNEFNIRKYELEAEIKKLNEELRKLEKEKERLKGQIKPQEKHFFGTLSEPAENIKIKEDIKIIDYEIRNKQEEIENKNGVLLSLNLLPDTDTFQNTQQLKQLVIELKHRIDKYNTHKMMIKMEKEYREQLKRETKIRKEIQEKLEKPETGIFGTTNWQKTLDAVKSIFGQYSPLENAEDTDDVTLPPDIETNPLLSGIEDADVESGEEEIKTNLAQTSTNLERAISISAVSERQNSVNNQKANEELRNRLQRLRDIIDLLREKIKNKNKEYDEQRHVLSDRAKITSLKIKHVIKLDKLGEDIEKINKEIEHIENLLKLINSDGYVNTVKGNLEKYCFPILYQEFDNIYNLESIKNIIQKRVPIFNIGHMIKDASSKTPLTIDRVKSESLPQDDINAFTRWLQQTKGKEYGKLTTKELQDLYEEFKKLPTPASSS